MERRYSEYSEHELRDELARLKVKAQNAEQMGMINEFEVYQRKMVMAEAYMMDPKDYKKGEVYELEGAIGETFTINYLKGVFAWGTRRDIKGEIIDEEEALPISLLKNKIELY